MKQRKSVPAPRCVSFTQSDADKLPDSECCRSFSGVLAGRSRVSPSPLSAGSFAGSFNLVLHNSLMPKHRSWRRGSESNRRMQLLQSRALPLGYPAASNGCSVCRAAHTISSFVAQLFLPADYPVKPSSRRRFQSSCGLKIPSGVMMPVMSSAGVTSKPGLRAPLVGLATRM